MLCALFAMSSAAQKKKKEIVSNNPKVLMEKIEWESPKRTNVASIDGIYDRGDTIYMHIQEICDSLVFYDVVKIANSDTGDTIVAVVDENGFIRSKYAAFNQYSTAAIAGLQLTADAVSLAADATTLGITLILNPAEVLSVENPKEAMKDFKKASKQLGSMSKIVPNIFSAFKKQRNKIQYFIKTGSIPKPSDKKDKVTTDGLAETVLSKTSQQILDEMAKTEELDGMEKGKADIDKKL